MVKQWDAVHHFDFQREKPWIVPGVDKVFSSSGDKVLS